MARRADFKTEHLPPERLLLWAVLLVAGVLRLARLDLMAFEMDEGAACILAVKLAHYGLPPLIGVRTSLQFYNSPLFIYFISPAFLVTTDPRFAAAVFALLGTAAVYVVYRTGREFFSPAVGLVAAAMMAVSPAAIAYSRRLWGHSLIQALAPIAFYLVLRWVAAGRAKAVFWLALLIAAAQQFHFSGALWWVQLLAAWLLFRPRTDWVGFFCGLALGLLGYVPFMIEQWDVGFVDLRIIGRAIVHGTGQPWSFHGRTVLYWLLAATDLGHNNFLQAALDGFIAAIPFYRAFRAIAGAAWVAALGGCAAWAVREIRAEAGGVVAALRRRRAARPVLMLTWALVPLAVFLALRVPVVAPYFLVIYPVPFLAIGWMGVEGWKKLASSDLGHRLRAVLVLLFAAWMAEQVVFDVALAARLARRGGGEGTYASFGTQREAMRFVAFHAPGRPVVVSEDQRDPAAGIETRHWYLLWMFDHNMERFFPADREKAAYWYVIRNTNYRVPAEFAFFLRRFPRHEFGFLRVYVIPRPGPWPKFRARR